MSQYHTRCCDIGQAPLHANKERGKTTGRIKTRGKRYSPNFSILQGKIGKNGEKDLTAHGGGGQNELQKASQDDMINMEFGCHAPHLKLSKG